MAAHSGSSLPSGCGHVEHGDLGAEPAERLRQLEPDRTAAEHDQVFRPLADLERVLVGEIGHLLESRTPTGTIGREPVAITKRRALISNLMSSSGPTTTVLLSRKRASPSITRTPSPVKRSLELFGAIASMTRWMWSLTSSNSTAGFADLMPNGAAGAHRLGALARRDHRLRRHAAGVEALAAHRPFSTSTTGTPSVAAAAATDNPAAPAPMTQRSGVSCSATGYSRTNLTAL